MADSNTTSTAMSPSDSLEAVLAQAEAMAFVMQGEDFATWRDDIQANYMWALQWKITEARQHFAAMRSKPTGGSADE